jgi:6-phosphofructokinase 1
MNAAVRAVVRTASYHDLHIYGIYGGYEGMINGNIKRLEKSDVGNIIHRGGTVLKTARSMEFHTKEGRQKAYENLKDLQIDACVCIGGNGTYTGAKVFSEEYKDIQMVGVPGTIDNDIFGTDYTIGFDTAVNTAIEAVDRIRDTASSHNRLFFIEVMGRHAGFIALSTGIGSGAGNFFLPEEDESLEEFTAWLKKSSRRQKLFNLIIVAEGNTEGGATAIAEKVKKEVPEFDTKVTIIGHLQRGGSPSSMDRVLASRLGYGAVNALLEGEDRIALGIVNDQISYTSFDDAITKSKRPHEDLVQMARILAM